MADGEQVKQMDEDRRSMISQMSQAVIEIPKSDIQEVKSLASPPACVKDVTTAVLILLGEKDTDWKATKRYMGQTNALQKIAQCDTDSIPAERRQKARKILENYTLEKVENASKATSVLYQWAEAVSSE